jgi:hypothetical protein
MSPPGHALIKNASRKVYQLASAFVIGGGRIDVNRTKILDKNQSQEYLRAPIYMGGFFCFVSRDLAEYIMSDDCHGGCYHGKLYANKNNQTPRLLVHLLVHLHRVHARFSDPSYARLARFRLARAHR